MNSVISDGSAPDKLCCATTNMTDHNVQPGRESRRVGPAVETAAAEGSLPAEGSGHLARFIASHAGEVIMDTASFRVH